MLLLQTIKNELHAALEYRVRGAGAMHAVIDDVIAEVGDSSMQSMGKIIGGVKAKAGAAADGATVARLVKERLSQ